MARARSYGVRVGRMKTKDGEYPIYCSSSGKFSVLNFTGTGEIPDDEEIEPLANGQDNMEAAEGAARAMIRKRKVKVAVPFIFLDGNKGVAWGIHGGNGDILARDEAGEAHRLSRGWSRRPGEPRLTKGVFIDDIPADRLERYREIIDETEKLDAEKQEIENWFGVDLGQLVVDAIDTKLAEQAETEPKED